MQEKCQRFDMRWEWESLSHHAAVRGGFTRIKYLNTKSNKLSGVFESSVKRGKLIRETSALY